MNKMQMAHEYAKTLAANPVVLVLSDEDIADRAWRYADAMQAEAEKREDKTRPEVLEEWQPDWSQAPEWANWWAMDEDKKTRWIYSEFDQPYISDMFSKWCAIGRFDSEAAPPFNYQGNWQDSLRKRPQ